MNEKATTRLLVIEDNAGDARLIREMLNDQESHSTELTRAESMGEAENYLAEHQTDVILLDLGLPDVQGVAAVQRAHAAAPHAALLVLTGMDDESLALRTLQEGAQDYLIKGQIEARGLLRAMHYAVERKIMEEALFVEKERAQVTLNSIGDAVISTDVSGNITFLNLVAETMTGWSYQDAIGRPLTDVFQVLDATTREPVPSLMEIAIAQDKTVRQTSNCILIRRDGSEIQVDDPVSPIHDREGQAAGAVIVCRDVSVARKMSLQIAHSAEHDFLTGLPNRMLLNDRISQAIVLAPRHNRQVAVLFLDLDGFKHINDSLGHSIGDKLLQSIAKRLVACVRSSDTVSRQGGDEFVVLLSDAEQWEDAAIIAKRLLETVAEVHSIDQHDLHITTSIGVSIFPDDGLDAETLIMNADTAMYQAKENGRQGFQYFKPAMNVRAVERQSIEESLGLALGRQEFVLHYQPKIDLKTGAVAGAEALIRWNHPTRGMVFPGRFIPVAEDCGLIRSIDKWVLHEACSQARAWVDAGLPETSFAINVSAIELRDENFLKDLFAIIGATGINPKSLQLEVTESVLMKHAASAAHILGAVRERGIQVAIDDFGTGYSSLSYLRKFPIDALKIDQSFVRQISAVDEDTTIVTAIISMAQNLKLRVIAEGVETAEELAFLQAHQCDEAQGYFLGGPMTPEKFEDLLRTGIADPSAVIRPTNFVVDVATADQRDPIRLSAQPRLERAIHGQHDERDRRQNDRDESSRRES